MQGSRHVSLVTMLSLSLNFVDGTLLPSPRSFPPFHSPLSLFLWCSDGSLVFSWLWLTSGGNHMALIASRLWLRSSELTFVIDFLSQEFVSESISLLLWGKSPIFDCPVSKLAQNVAVRYAADPWGLSQWHPQQCVKCLMKYGTV